MKHQPQYSMFCTLIDSKCFLIVYDILCLEYRNRTVLMSNESDGSVSESLKEPSVTFGRGLRHVSSTGAISSLSTVDSMSSISSVVNALDHGMLLS